MLLIGALTVALSTVTLNSPVPLRHSCETGDVSLSVAADTLEAPPLLCISPGLSTSLIFDGMLGRVDLEEGEHFRQVIADEGLILIPAETIRGRGPLMLTVHFTDGLAPESARFLLVVHPALAVRQVDIIRRTRPVLFYQQQFRQQRDRAEQCEKDKQRLQVDGRGSSGFRGLRELGMLEQGNGVNVLSLLPTLKQKPGGAVIVADGWSYNFKTRWGAEFAIVNPSTKPWRAEGALMRARHGEYLPLLPLSTWVSMPGQANGSVIVEIDATETQGVEGPYSLTFWDADQRVITVENVTFP